MLKGLMITPPVIGRISIGRVVEKNGKRFPGKDDEFTLTTQIQRAGIWIPHPLNDNLRETYASEGQKLRRIPVRMLFDDPELNLRVSYNLFDRQSGRPLCVGDGEHCKRVVDGNLEKHPCPSPDACPLGMHGYCKPYGRLNVVIGEEDPLGSFIFRTTGFNSIRTLSARLRYYHAITKGKLSTLPLELRLRGKSTTQSYRTPIFYVDLVIAEGLTLEQAIQETESLYQQRQEAGFDQATLDQAAREGFAMGAFEDSEEEGINIVEEFYPDTHPSSSAPIENSDLSAKINAKHAALSN